MLKYLSILFLLITWTCTPKVAEEMQKSTSPKKPFVAGPCGTFNQYTNPQQAIEWHVLYRDAIKQKNFKDAEYFWRKVFKVAPAADGKRRTQFLDGVAIYENKIKNLNDIELRNKYVDSIFMMYDGMENCYETGDGYVAGLKGFDLYFNYPGKASNEEVWELLKSSYDKDGDTANVFIVNPMADLIVQNYFDSVMSLEEASTYAKNLLRRIDIAQEKGKNLEAWNIVKDYTPERLSVFEGVRGFYDCTYFKEKYYNQIGTLPTDCDELRDLYGKLRFGGCAENDPAFSAIEAAIRENCKVERSGAGLAYESLQNGNYEEAIAKFQEAIDASDDMERKAKYEFLISKIYYAHLRDFPKAREWALKAADTKPNWGEPFILIGQLYASSGPLCGPGRGWDSQIVVWPAIDKWNYAKRIDPSIASEANKWISRYTQFMPSTEDRFQRSLEEGASFYVGCWIKESTTIRTRK